MLIAAQVLFFYCLLDAAADRYILGEKQVCLLLLQSLAHGTIIVFCFLSAEQQDN